AKRVHDLPVLEACFPGHRSQSEAPALVLHAAGGLESEADSIFLGEPAAACRLVIGPPGPGGHVESLLKLLNVAESLQRKLVDSPHPCFDGRQVLLHTLDALSQESKIAKRPAQGRRQSSIDRLFNALRSGAAPAASQMPQPFQQVVEGKEGFHADFSVKGFQRLRAVVVNPRRPLKTVPDRRLSRSLALQS